MIDRDDFMKKYYDLHNCCPKCHSRKIEKNLLAIPFNEDHPEEYKDRNRCVCTECGWKGPVYELAPNPETYHT